MQAFVQAKQVMKYINIKPDSNGSFTSHIRNSLKSSMLLVDSLPRYGDIFTDNLLPHNSLMLNVLDIPSFIEGGNNWHAMKLQTCVLKEIADYRYGQYGDTNA